MMKMEDVEEHYIVNMEQKKPKVSIVLTSYNHAPFLRQAIESVINQSYENWELLIWDDLSTDDSWDIIQSYSSPKIKSIRNNKTRRYIYAINESIVSVAKGEYIAIHHSDDAWHLDKLASQVAYMDNNHDVGAVFTHVQLIDENNQHLNNDWFNCAHMSREQWLRNLFMNKNQLCHPSALVRRSEYIRAGLYKLIHAQIDDAEMWTRLLMKSDIYVIPEKLTLHRIFSNGKNVSGDSPTTRARLQFEWFEQKKNYLNLSVEEIINIFPEVKQWISTGKDSDAGYLLAMAAIHLGHCQNTSLFGLNLLYSLLTDSDKAQFINENHGFDYLDFMKLSGREELFATEVRGKDTPTTVNEAARQFWHQLSLALRSLIYKTK